MKNPDEEKEKKEYLKNPIRKNENRNHLKISLVSQNTRKTSQQPEHPSKRNGHSVILNYQGMVIFSGRHNLRNVSNIYTLDIQTLTWAKVEQVGICPAARDYHTAVEVYFII